MIPDTTKLLVCEKEGINLMECEMRVKLSIITPVYNRAYILNELYESLTKQTSKEFEWIVIDDGSTDNTWELLKEYKEAATPFPIIIQRQENQGKHIAVNLAVTLAKGEFVFIVDSDDYLTEDAVETVCSWIEQVRDREDIAAVAGLRGNKVTGECLGRYSEGVKAGEWIEAKNTERRKYKLSGDKAEVYRTELLRSHLFPKFGDEKFLSEECVWNQLAMEGYWVRWYNKIIYWCDYLPDGLTKNAEKELKNFDGFTFTIRQRIKCLGKVEGLFARGFYYEVAKRKGIGWKEAAERIDTSCALLLSGYMMRKLKGGLTSFGLVLKGKKLYKNE